MADKKTETKDGRLEREYVIPLRPEWRKVSRYKRTNKAVKAVKEFLVRHMKIRDRDLNKVRIDKFLNEELWRRGIKNPPTKIKVKAIKEEGIVRVELVEIPKDIKFKKARIEKRDEKAREIVESKKSTMTRLKEAASGAGRKSEKSLKGPETTEEKTDETVEKEKAEESKEKEASTISAEEKIEKQISKSQKHSAKIKTEKQMKGQRTGYNATSRGK